jgi:beta-xylosidase
MFFILTVQSRAQSVKDEYKVPLSSISLSDPFIFADKSDSKYYMYGSGGNGTVMVN